MTLPGQLFRPEAVEARRVDWLGSIDIGGTRYGTAFAACALACLAGLACLLMFSHYTRHERVDGALVPSGGVVVIASSTSGVVTRCLVAEGDVVVEGQTLAEISTRLDSVGLGDTQTLVGQRLREQQASLRSDLLHQQNLVQRRGGELAARIEMLQHQVALLESQRELKERQMRSAQALLSRLQPLREKGLIGAIEWDQRESAALDAGMQLKGIVLQKLDAHRELDTARSEVAQLPMDGMPARNDIERKLADVAQAIARNEAERGVLVRAPRAGTVAGLTIGDGANVVAGQRIASLIPAGSQLQAELWLPSRAIGFVTAGGPVVLRYDAYPYQTFGSYGARVLDVSESALTPSELERLRGRHSEEPMYRVTVALDAQSVEAFGRLLPLRTDMTLEADVLMERQRLIDWIIAPVGSAVRGAGTVASTSAPEPA